MDQDLTPVVREIKRLKNWLMVGDMLLGIIMVAVLYYLYGIIIGPAL